MKIGYSAASDQAAGQYIEPVIDMLEEWQIHFKPHDYGKGIKEVIYMPILIEDRPSPALQHPEHKRYRKRKKSLELSLKPDYQAFVSASDTYEALGLVAERFYDAIDEYEALGVRDFNTAAFKRDVYEFFTANGYMPVHSPA